MTQEKKSAPTAVERFEELARELLAAELFVRGFSDRQLERTRLALDYAEWMGASGFPAPLEPFLRPIVQEHVREDLERALRELRTRVAVAGEEARAELRGRVERIDEVIKEITATSKADGAEESTDAHA